MIENSKKDNLYFSIKTVWRRRQKFYFTAGMLGFCRWLVPLFLAAIFIDWQMNLAAPFRVVLLAVLLGVSLYKAFKCGWRHGRFFNAVHSALQIEEHHGDLQSLLVTAVQLKDNGPAGGVSESMQESVCKQAEEAAGLLRPEEIVSYRKLRRPAMAGVVLVMLIAFFGFVNGSFLAAGVGRIFAPWAEIKYPTRTLLELVDGNLVVKEGDPARIRAKVSGVIPENAKLYLRTGKGKPRRHSLEVIDGVCEYSVATAYRSFDYLISAGDAHSDWHTVEVIDSPRIARAEVTLEFPEYTQRPTETAEALTITVPEGTSIKWELSLDCAVSKATYKPAGGEPNDLDISEDGLTVTMQQVAVESRGYSFSWVEREHGFAFDGASHYLQVSVDQPPRVEITSPKNNLYAMLGRKLDLAFRGRDDHGIGESFLAFAVNKTAEQKVGFTAGATSEGAEHNIDWDYRAALPNLAVGDSISFVIELTDRYPGDQGPHRARSQARRISFLSREDYLEHIARQKRRLLTRLKAIYRQQRGVYDIIRNLDPSAAEFVQTCQLEAVRQELMRERIIALKDRMNDLLEDLAANSITEESQVSVLNSLVTDLQNIADEHVARAAGSLRELAAVSNNGRHDPAEAVYMVNNSARQLGCLVMQLGYTEAAEVMAYELHAAAQTQVSLRLKTILLSGAKSDKAKDLEYQQQRLGKWLEQLFAAAPESKESTPVDAIIAFKLSRLVKKLRIEGGIAKMEQAVAQIENGNFEEALRIQSQVIASLVDAEFKLRVGAEHDALIKAGKLFKFQAGSQKQLRLTMQSLSEEQFKDRRDEFGQAQAALHLNLQLLLMPAIPAHRPRLFDDKYPQAPEVDELLLSAETALKNAAGKIGKGDRQGGIDEQIKAEQAFAALAQIVDDRINVVTEDLRLANLTLNCDKRANSISMLEERQLVLLEKVEDAAADKAGTGHLTGMQQGLADDAEKFRKSIILFNKTRGLSNEPDQPLLESLGRVSANMQKTVELLKNNEADKAAAQQDAAFELLEEANGLIAEQLVIHAGFASMYALTESALVPGPLLGEIESEQRDMMEATGKVKPDDLATLVIPQKNLVHAVDAVLDSLDPMAHRVESGATMLFAKTDMDAAAEAIEEKDIEEAQDAQSYVADSIKEIREKIDAISPHYSYLLEITEFLHEAMPDGITVRAQLRQLRGKIEEAKDDADIAEFAGEQNQLKATAERFGENLTKLTGHSEYSSNVKKTVEALARLKSGDKSQILDLIEEAEYAFIDDSENLGLLMENLAYLLAPPPSYVSPESAMDSAEVKLTLEVLDLAAKHKDLYRNTQDAKPEQLAEFAKLEEEYQNQCESFIELADPNDNLVTAKKFMAQALQELKSGSVKEARSSQYQADQALRYFIIDYVLEFVEVPPPAPPQDGAPTDDADVSDGELTLFMPGAVSGKAPKAGRVEWQVLGRRDRAALNENFARELPIEYRAILKDYYERLANDDYR